MEHQVQRHLILLTDQKKQVNQNKAIIAHQERDIKSLTLRETETIARLKKEAETQARREVIRLYEEAEKEVSKLRVAKYSLEKSLADGEKKLARLDDEIIEADAIVSDLEDKVLELEKRKSVTGREVGKEVLVLADLQKDIDDKQVKIKGMTKDGISLIREQEALKRDIESKTQSLKSIENSITTKQSKLESLQIKVRQASADLEDTMTKDKEARGALAQKELKLAEEKDNLKNKEEAIKKEMLANEQLQPQKWQNLERFDNLKGHYKM